MTIAPLDLRQLPPVAPEDNIERPETVSQTLLSHGDDCPRKMYLYRKYRGGPQSHPMARGEVFHQFAEEATLQCMRSDEMTMPGDVARDIQQDILDQRLDLVLSDREQDDCREMAWNWGEGMVVHPDQIVCVETMLTLDIGDWTIRGKVDLAEVQGPGVTITDYKTSFAVPNQEDYENDFQAKFYALLVAEGEVEGQPLPLGAGLDRFTCRQIFPRYRDKDTAELSERKFSLTRGQVYEFKGTVERLLRVLERGLREGEWPASPGDHCKTCPAAAECPIPAHLREASKADDHGRPQVIEPITTVAEAEQKAQDWYFHDAIATGLKKSLRGFCEENGPVYFGDLALDFKYSSSRSVKNWDDLMLAIQRTTQFGEPFDMAAHTRERQSTAFKKRKQTREEQDGS